MCAMVFDIENNRNNLLRTLMGSCAEQLRFHRLD